MRKSITFLLAIFLLALCVIPASYVHSQSTLSSVGTIRILPDGHIEGTDKIQVNGNVYTLTDDINVYLSDSAGDLLGYIVILKDNVVLDGAGHTVQANGTGVGVYLRGVENVTVKNLTLKGFNIGINTYTIMGLLPTEIISKTTRNNRFIDNTIEVVNNNDPYQNAGWGIFLKFIYNTYISGNTIKTQDPKKGIYIESIGTDWNGITLTNNKFVGSSLYLQSGLNPISAYSPSIYDNVIVDNNTIDGKPLVFLKGASNQIIENAEQIFLFSCSNMTIRNIHPSKDYFTSIQLYGLTNGTVTNCSGTISLITSSNNTVCENTANMIALYGDSNYNKIFANNLTKGTLTYIGDTPDYKNSKACIRISSSSFNEVYENNLMFANYGVYLSNAFRPTQGNNIYRNIIGNSSGAYGAGIRCSATSLENAIFQNKIANCSYGFAIGANELRIFENSVTNCAVGVSIYESKNNIIFNNDFINNKQPVFESHYSNIPFHYPASTNNTWDAGPAKGGNFWSTYNGTDNNNDGIGDTPYQLFENHTDRYPSMKPFTTEIVQFPTFSPAPTTTSSSFPASSSSPIIPSPISSNTASPITTSTPTSALSTPIPSPTATVPELSNWTILILALITALIATMIIRRKQIRQ